MHGMRWEGFGSGEQSSESMRVLQGKGQNRLAAMRNVIWVYPRVNSEKLC